MLTILALWAALLAIRLAGPSDLLDNDQLGPAAYANDALVNGHWFVQTEVSGAIASKPPLTTWLIALLSLPAGHATPLTLAIPSALGVLGCALLAGMLGTRVFGDGAGLAAALALLLSPMGAKQVTLVRTDAVFAFTIALMTVLVWHAWRRGRGWFWVWLSAAALTLTKGPIGIPIALAGLLAGPWERRSARSAEATSVERPARPRRALEHAAGAVVFLALVGGWFLLAWHDAGQPFIDKVIGAELIGHAIHSGSGGLPLVGFYLPPLYFLSRFAPASVFTCIALWNVWKHPSPDEQSRLLERFLACAFVLGMALFCISPHQRADLLTALWLPASVLAGREIAQALAPLAPRPRAAVLGAWALGALGAAFVFHTLLAAGGKFDVRSRGLEALAKRTAPLIDRVPLIHVDDNSALQLYLGTMDHRVAPEAAADALASSSPVLVATSAKGSDLDALLGARGMTPHVVASWTDEKGWGVRILANDAARAALAPEHRPQ